MPSGCSNNTIERNILTVFGDFGRQLGVSLMNRQLNGMRLHVVLEPVREGGTPPMCRAFPGPYEYRRSVGEGVMDCCKGRRRPVGIYPVPAPCKKGVPSLSFE